MSFPEDDERYQILDTLGQGGFATVYRARDRKLNRDVAIKVLHPHLASDSDIVARFRREASAIAGLDHPNIGVIYDWSEKANELYIVMRLLPGTPLDLYLQQHGALTLEESLPLLRQMAAALDYAHSRGLLHRDVKPSNAILDNSGRVTLTDFGIAKSVAGEGTMLTGTGQTLGTPAYMAPEQVEGAGLSQVSPATDQYSLAIVAYQMLTGQVPFTGSMMSVMYAHRHQPPPDPRTLGVALPEAVIEVLLRALSKDPLARYPSVSAFVSALEEAKGREGHASLPDLAAGASQTMPAFRAASDIPDATERLAPPAPLPPVSTPERSSDTPRPAASTARAGRSGIWLGGALLALLVLVGTWWALTQTEGRDPGVNPTATRPAEEQATDPVTTPTGLSGTSAEAPTPTSETVPSITPAPTVVETPAAGASTIAPIDFATLVFVPAGEFVMGAAESDDSAGADAKPQHTVTLDGFWIDRNEVTNASYALCVADGTCVPPTSPGSSSRERYFDDPAFSDFPVIHVSWNDARTYCEWAGRRLPTEAEWEKAARGEDARPFPWGTDAPTGERLNFCDSNCPFDWRNSDVDDGFADTAPVGSYPEGVSPYGAKDMSGNVWEWVSDWYGADYYAISPASNPQGPESGDGKVHRGGAWDDVVRQVTARGLLGPDDRHPFLGFRCAVSE